MTALLQTKTRAQSVSMDVLSATVVVGLITTRLGAGLFSQRCSMSNPKVYAVVDWPRLFEKAQSRRCASALWVAVPNKHDGNGYRRIVAYPDSCQIFTAWILILEVASKMPERGILYKDGYALDAEDLAIKTGFPTAIFELAFEKLQDKKVQWLCHDTRSAVRARYEDAQPTVHNSTVHNKTEQNKEDNTMCSELQKGFDSFWEAYPRKANKQTAKAAYENHVPLELMATVAEAVDLQKQSSSWMDNESKFIPHPTTWLNQHRWEDELDTDESVVILED